MALEGSTASWMEVKEETSEVRERLSSKVLGYYEVPAPQGTKKAIVQLAFPIAAWEENVNVPMMLLSIPLVILGAYVGVPLIVTILAGLGAFFFTFYAILFKPSPA